MPKSARVDESTESADVERETTFRKIAAKYGEEAAINAGIAVDPDARELTDEEFAQMRPAIEVDPELVRHWRQKTRQETGKPMTPKESNDSWLPAASPPDSPLPIAALPLSTPLASQFL